MTLSYTILISSEPNSTPSLNTALNFMGALLDQGHTIKKLFLHQNGVYSASRLTLLPDDEIAPPVRLQKFLEAHQITSVLCVGSALRRGILDKQYAKKMGEPLSLIAKGFELGGLAQLCEAIANSDRFIQFGN